MISYRLVKVSKQIKRNLTQLINYNLNDPRIKNFIIIHSVKLSKDLSLADIYWTLLYDNKFKNIYESILQLASGYLRYKLSKTIKNHHVPILTFHFYDSITITSSFISE
ncbi:30S ribosome-binding factor RbfA [Candidatus Portiera aleyrodidarum]|uniref:30S ribosome-binding factor RbfA n=1 Tax=Candidatus Portiera aleyrodidarum TaxID=91844 RepID=UPI000C775813|nr:30S ribosome-binding factor RbfA [Candidatus Portiera aleyrodidarum]AUI73311.1 ribosome-binding factor A [Candidatus Portiera aleyrodidarum]